MVFDRYFENPPQRRGSREPHRSQQHGSGGASQQQQQQQHQQHQQLSYSGQHHHHEPTQQQQWQQQQQHTTSTASPTHPRCSREEHHWASVTTKPLSDVEASAPGARKSAAAAVTGAGAGARLTAAAAAHAFPRGDWQHYPAGACGGTGFGGVAKHPLQLGAAGAPWGRILGSCSTASTIVPAPSLSGASRRASSDGGRSGGSSRRASRDNAMQHGGRGGAPATPPSLGGSRPDSTTSSAFGPFGGGSGWPQQQQQQQQQQQLPFVHTQPRQQREEYRDYGAHHHNHQQTQQYAGGPRSAPVPAATASYPFPPYRTAADGGVDYGPSTPNAQPRPPAVFAPRASATEEFLPAPGGPPTLSTLQLAAMRDRGRLPPHRTATTLVPTGPLLAATTVRLPSAERLGGGMGLLLSQGDSRGTSRGSGSGSSSGGGGGAARGAYGGISAAALASVGSSPDHQASCWLSRTSGTPMSPKLAAAAQRSGLGAASCLRFDY